VRSRARDRRRGAVPVIDPSVRTPASAGQARIVIELRTTPPFTSEIGADPLARLDAAGDLVARVRPDARRFPQL
jgi:hypothetical protein